MTVVTDPASALILKLCEATQNLARLAEPLQLVPLSDREWHELLTRKLKPQLGAEPYLVTAVVGGTNIGKSVVFNHLAGARVSATVPTASGTRHPTALIHPRLGDRLDFEAVFPGFEVAPWERPDQPLQEDSRHLLFCRRQERIPENLIILDTPDVDSIAVVNWERAAHLRQIADVLVVVLTQQKYNDLAIRDFFRAAADEGKLVVVIFNQCQLPDDETYWPLWMETFSSATGITPHVVYLAPYNRQAAESNTLPFYERDWPIVNGHPVDEQPHNLMEDLSRLKFDDIKRQALAGALRHVADPHTGILSWLKEIDNRSGEFADALSLLSSERLATVDRWPTLPNSVLIQHVRAWWGRQRAGWTRLIHETYNHAGQLITAPIRWIRQPSSSGKDSPLESYRRQEWNAILAVLERCFDRLEQIRDVGNPLLKQQIDQLLSGVSRAEVLRTLRQEHERIDFDLEIQQLVDTQLRNFREERPDYDRLLRRLDSMAAAARPVVSLGLFVIGVGPVGDAIVPIATDAAVRGALHLAGDAVGGTVVTVVGDKVLSETASQSAGYLETRFRQLHTAFSQRRGEWLSSHLNRDLLKGLPEELTAAAQIRSSPEYQLVRTLSQELQMTLLSIGLSGSISSQQSAATT